MGLIKTYPIDRIMIGSVESLLLMDITLKPEQEQFIQSQLMTDKYESAEQVPVSSCR